MSRVVTDFDADAPTATGRRHVPVAADDDTPYLPPLIPECDYGDVSRSVEWFACGMPGCA